MLKLHKPDVGNHFGKQVSKVLADILQVEVLQATIIGVMKEDHDYHHLRLGQCGITVILSLFPRLYRVFCPTVKLEVQLLHRLPPSLERSGKGGGRRWKPGIRVIRQYKIKKGDLCLPRINYFCIVYEV